MLMMFECSLGFWGVVMSNIDKTWTKMFFHATPHGFHMWKSGQATECNGVYKTQPEYK